MSCVCSFVGGGVTFLLLLAVAGLLASLIGTWIFVALVAAIMLPIYVIAAVFNGFAFGSAFGQAVLGIVAFQISYGVGALLQATFRPRGNPPPPEIPLPQGRPRESRIFGVWLPLIALYDVPCEADGSPWDGKQDPNFRVTILVVGWFGRAISLTVGEPWIGSGGPAWTKRFSLHQGRVAPAPLNSASRTSAQRPENEER